MSGALARLLPQVDFTAKSVLGVHCLETCILAASSKAERVVCILPDADLAVAKSRLGESNIELWPLSGGWPEARTFDIVICIDRPAHARHPFSTIHAMVDIARETILIDLPAMGVLAPRMAVPPGVAPAVSPFPMVLVSRNGSTGKSHAPKFLFSRRSLSHLLMRHRGDIAQLAISSDGGRIACLAQRRRIGHLILVSGPVSAGKSVFIDALRAGQLPDVGKALGLMPDERLPVLGTSAKAERGPARIPVAIAHYGFLRPYLRSAAVAARDEALDIVKVAEKVSIITLLVSPKELQRRISQGEIDSAPGGKASARHLRLREEYGDPARLREHYDRWFEVAERLADNNFIAEYDSRSPTLEVFQNWHRRQPIYQASAKGWSHQEVAESESAGAQYARLLPEDIAGSSLLVMGSGSGKLCHMAAQRGAKSIVGLDHNADLVAVARQSGQVDFRSGGLEALAPEERFDTVICLQDIGLERDPLAYVDGLAARARKNLIFACSPGKPPGANASYLPKLLRSLTVFLPAIVTFRNGAANNRGEPKFVLTRKALTHALLSQRRLFSDLRYFELAPGRQCFAFAHKFRIPHLIVVAGPVSSGKSTLCRRLLSGEVDWIYDKLGVTQDRRPRHVYLPRARGSKPPSGDVVLFHYNMLNAYLSTAHVHENDENLDIMRVADRVSVLTVWAEPEALVRQITKSEIDGGLFHRPTRRHLMLREEYRDAERVRFHYEAWLRFAAQHGQDNFVVATHKSETVMLSPAQWRNSPARAQA